MDMSNFRLESHIAQQSRRDKLRVQHNSTNQAQHLEEYPNNLEQLSVDEGLNSPDLVQVRSVRPYANMSYELAMFPPEMLNFGRNSQLPLAHKDAMMVHQESAAAQTADRQVTAADVSFANSAPNFNSSSKASGDPQNCSTWKSIGSQQSCDWIVNYSSGSTGMESNQNPTFVGQGLSGSLKVNNNVCSSPLYMKTNYSGYQDIQTSLTNPSSEISSQNSQRHYEEMHFNSPASYGQKNLQGVVTSAATETEGLAMASLVQQDIRDTGRGSWEDGGSELLLLPTYGNQSSALGLSDAFAQINRARWGGELGFLANKSGGDHLRTIASDSNTQGLSLSLSPLPQSKTHGSQFNGEYNFGRVDSSADGFNDISVSKTLKSGYLYSNSEPSIGSKGFGNASHDMVGTSTLAHRHTGPLGPFTGYATILKNSKFLKPAQQLLDEFCGATGPKLLKTYEVSEKVSDKTSQEVRVTADAVHATESMVGAKGRDTSASTSTFYSSNEICSEAGVGSSSGESYRPEYLQKKAKLLYMQEEVCGRYKQYHQQMQMVVSSFESVAGLSAATPYISLALKTVMRHFKCLKNTISNQLRHIRKALGEDLQSPTAGTSCSKGDTSQSRQKFIDHRFEKLKHGGDSLGFFEPQQHIWRPQRGLPERSVAILRAWLFDHFLHPYPTDTDKHMLATQTGLTRNQVSNWFINARVRVWKPMVEEIHMLETKGLAEANTNPGKNDDKPTTEVANWTNENQTTNRASTNAMPNKQVEGSAGICSLMSAADGQSAADQWNGEKRSRLDCQIPASVDDSLIGFVPYQQSGLEMRGLGAVSLTLGLRQSVESAQQQQHLQQQEQQLRQHFGGQMVHDFVG